MKNLFTNLSLYTKLFLQNNPKHSSRLFHVFKSQTAKKSAS